MEQAVVSKKSLRAILIVSAFSILTTACAGGKPFKYQEIDAIAKGGVNCQTHGGIVRCHCVAAGRTLAG